MLLQLSHSLDSRRRGVTIWNSLCLRYHRACLLSKMLDESNRRPLVESFDPFSGSAILLTVQSTGPQREIWLATRVGTDASLAFNESVSLRLTGSVNVDALTRAAQALVNRHDALRSTFTPDGLTVCVAAPDDLDVPFIDCSQGLQTERESTWRELLNNAGEEPFDIERGPLVRVTVLRYGPQEYRAILTAHHIVCDGWSTAVLLKDWADLYSALATGSSPTLAPADSFSAYALE
jgi:Condensation domain